MIMHTLTTYDPVTVPNMDPSLHYLAPHVPKVTWTALGDLVSSREREPLQRVVGERWISLRLDGSGFSRAVRMLRNRGVLESTGFSVRFANCMQSCLRSLMEKFQACLGFTQSDEMILFIPPTSVVRGERQVHIHSGRALKLCTLASGFVTARFMAELAKLLVTEGKGVDGLAEVLPHFDCRLGHYASWGEARALLMWRAYDCSVNGVSDAVHHSQIEGKKQAMGLGKREKVAWLLDRGLLPLPRHQAYGSLFAKRKREVDGFNPKTGEHTKTLRGVIEHVDGPVLELLRKQVVLFDEVDT
eukprot:CAMPEP_0198545932 /NCGR_PEP_ID=MMETSP1462-20131121/65758_1 /TAXON_ID=1333877 /ORGANISM="Brandtodinium nutriculum, Strain RCC3387" /LENGTH=300 /DNA_ID=CAMNT_0044276349 /DNA_START=200 /DNA_END=1102 /DNA_ORIENTATION=-